MTRRYVMAAIVGLLWMVTCASQAQDAAAASDAAVTSAPSSVLALSVGPDVVDRDALRAALEAELGVIVEDAGNAAAYMPTLSVIKLPNGNTEVALASRTVPRSTREFLLSAQIPQERVEMVTLIAANLIRNEAAALLPELRPKPVPAVEPPAPAAPPAPVAQLVDPCTPAKPREFGIDLAPGVGASSTPRGKKATRAVSLAFVGSLYDRLQGVEIGWTGANIVRKSVCGAQVSVVGANVSWGPVVGAQLATVNLVKGSVRGVQLGLVDFDIGDVVGAQLALVAVVHGHMHGAQLSLVNYARRGFEGAQLSLLNLGLGDSTGAQVGLVNHEQGNIRGAQLGLVNVATGRANFQLGLVNYADRSDASIGLLSFVRHGRTSVDLTGTIDSSLLFASVTHGGKYVHNILGVGMRANPGDTRFAMQYGVGVRALSNRWLRLDIDVLSQNVYNNDLKRKGTSMIATVRVPVTVMITRGLGVMAAVTYNFSSIDKDETRQLDNFGATVVSRGDPTVRSWPGATLGLRYEFDHSR